MTVLNQLAAGGGPLWQLRAAKLGGNGKPQFPRRGCLDYAMILLPRDKLNSET